MKPSHGGGAGWVCSRDGVGGSFREGVGVGLLGIGWGVPSGSVGVFFQEGWGVPLGSVGVFFQERWGVPGMGWGYSFTKGGVF